MITRIGGRHLIYIIMCLLSFSPASALASHPADFEVVPMPQRIEMQKGEPFVLNGDVQIIAGEGLQQEAGFLQAYLKDLTDLSLSLASKREKKKTDLSLSLASKREKKKTYIELAVSPKVTSPEGYVLTIHQKGITIEGGSSAGVFYGIQTLRKSIASRQIPAAVVTDAPRFTWRGMHLDCSRHFFSVDFVKKFIDLLALHNMNRFHWHLTDDQGWRIEIKKWPKLISVGSNRSGTIIGTNSDIDDGIPYGGYYTQDEAREIVAYAAARHITVIPEIDMPGHMLAALASYPELGCTGGPYQVGHYWGVYKDVLCVSNERVYQFVEDVLAEIMDIFPSEVIHIGGDETPTDKWLQCPRCQALRKQLPAPQQAAEDFEPLTSKLSPLQAHFTRKVFDFLTSKGRRALGWDEILDGSPQSAMIMSWRGTEPGAKAAETGHDVVMTPTTYCYFDYQQVKDTQFEPSRCGGFIPIEKVYSLDPAPDSLSVTAREHILGAQANLWAEYMTNEAMVEYQALPRMSALSEVQWTQPERKDYEAFKERLTRLTALFELYHYQYAKHLWPDRQIPSRWQF